MKDLLIPSDQYVRTKDEVRNLGRMIEELRRGIPAGKAEKAIIAVRYIQRTEDVFEILGFLLNKTIKACEVAENELRALRNKDHDDDD